MRQFRCEGSQRVLAAKVEPYRFFGPVGIKAQCQSDYFYGDDGVMESTLQDAENTIAPILVEVLRREHFDAEEEQILRLLAVLLHTRTRKNVEAAKQFPLRYGRETIKRGIASGDLPPPKGGWKDEMLDFKGTHFLLLKIGIRCWMEMHTLACKILRAPNAGIITSDNPSLLLNQFTQASLPARSFVGYAQTGFQLLVPVSPFHYLYFYDPKVYKVGSGRSQVVHVSEHDVDLLNGLQVQSAENCVYFNEGVSEPALKNLVEESAKRRLPVDSALEVLPGSGEVEEFVRIRPLTVRTAQPWKFSGYRRHVSSQRGTLRNPGWTDLVGRTLKEFRRDPTQGDIFDRMISLLPRA